MNRAAKEGQGREGASGGGSGGGSAKKSANGTVEPKKLGDAGKVTGGKAHGAVGGVKSAVPVT